MGRRTHSTGCTRLRCLRVRKGEVTTETSDRVQAVAEGGGGGSGWGQQLASALAAPSLPDCSQGGLICGYGSTLAANAVRGMVACTVVVSCTRAQWGEAPRIRCLGSLHATLPWHAFSTAVNSSSPARIRSTVLIAALSITFSLPETPSRRAPAASAGQRCPVPRPAREHTGGIRKPAGCAIIDAVPSRTGPAAQHDMLVYAPLADFRSPSTLNLPGSPGACPTASLVRGGINIDCLGLLNVWDRYSRPRSIGEIQYGPRGRRPVDGPCRCKGARGNSGVRSAQGYADIMYTRIDTQSLGSCTA
ncbi:hypothetical protein BU26DRAFT_325128 [Trematosphaeria pertusa]|uniref:Uncharacterized protein n=1 Tax=Trematosphaeria pertusa TaxID=390896 RepID=A0A6A6ID29_9PLEO|nr:uncharacterized protein BU26DRAFT_325128 [Trematosphaeria pertusa]KAF2247968.1 hypothetical protein BU26DRAFT_325128 [Trematosphaeria pertusa]